MEERTRFVILSLEGQRYAIPLASIVEITVARDIQRDRSLTEVFEGKAEYRGKLMPVLNAKKLFRLPGLAGNILLVLKSSKGLVGFLVDAVAEILETDRKPAPFPPGVVNPSLTYYRGILKHQDGLVLVLNEEGML